MQWTGLNELERMEQIQKMMNESKSARELCEEELAKL